MRPDLAAARRRAVVRDAARAWRSAGAIDENALRAIEERYADDRVSQSPVWRALIFLFVCVIASSLAGILFTVLRPSKDSSAFLALAFGIALAGATEVQQGRRRFDGTGGEAATSLASVVSLIAGVALLLPRSAPDLRLGAIGLASSLLWGAAWWRWGFPIYAVFAWVSALLGAGQVVGAIRIFWLLSAAAATVIAWRIENWPSLAPPHRTGWTLIFAAAVASAYAAVNLFSLDHEILERLRPDAALAPPYLRAIRLLFAAATALLPLAVLAAGLRSRRRIAIDTGLALAALSLLTMHAYVHLGPLWLVLAETGVAAVLLAMIAERFLSQGNGHERFGLTAEPLFEDERRVRHVTAAATAVIASPAARPAAEAPEFTPGGGTYGGGGASGTF